MRARVMLACGMLAALMAGVVFAQAYDPGLELSVIERLTKARDEYKASLTELQNFYLRAGDITNARRSERELMGFNLVEHYDFATKTTGKVEAPIKLLTSIPMADEYFMDARIIGETPYKVRKDIAISRYKRILTDWSDSDKAPLAAYQLGEIYSSFYYHDFDLAAQHYQKAYDLDPATTLPALYKAGKMYEKVQRYDDAVKMYKAAVTGSRDPETKKDAQKALDRIAANQGK